jgi:hypothetical protein
MSAELRQVDLVVTELAVIGFPEGRATLLETGNFDRAGPGGDPSSRIACRKWCYEYL